MKETGKSESLFEVNGMSRRSKRTNKRKAKANVRAQPPRIFRFHHPSGHHAIIVSQNGNEVEGYTVSHKPASGKRRSYKLVHNPKVSTTKSNRLMRDSAESHLHLQSRKGRIGHEFSKHLSILYFLDQVDEKTLDKILKAKKEGKPLSTYLTEKEKERLYPKKKK